MNIKVVLLLAYIKDYMYLCQCKTNKRFRIMTKKEIIENIRTKLNELGVSKDGCYNLDLEISKGKRISWVSRSQVMISTQIMGSVWKNKRYPIYSKTITHLLLVVINSVLNE